MFPLRLLKVLTYFGPFPDNRGNSPLEKQPHEALPFDRSDRGSPPHEESGVAAKLAAISSKSPSKEEPAHTATAIAGAAAIALLVLQQTGVADITIGEAVAYLFTLFATLNDRMREKVTAQAKG